MESVDQVKMPFVVVQGHRPMYTTNNEVRDHPIREKMLEHLEQLLVDNKVNLAVWGHVHRYERFCPINNYKCGSGPVHVVIGYTKLFANKERLTLTYIDGEIHDSVEILATGKVVNGKITSIPSIEGIDRYVKNGKKKGKTTILLYVHGACFLLFGLVVGYLVGLRSRAKKG